MIEANVAADIDEALLAAANDLLTAAMTYWAAYRRVTGGAAVVWLKDSDDRMVVLTRGEYKDVLMQNITKLGHDVRRFD